MPMGEVVNANRLCYCEHFRDNCAQCMMDFENMNRAGGFQEEAPFYLVENLKTNLEDLMIHKRWRQLQKIMYPNDGSDDNLQLNIRTNYEAKNSAVTKTSAALDGKSLENLVFETIELASGLRYQFANEIQIQLQDYETFLSSQELLEFEVIDCIGKMLTLRSFQKEEYQEITSRANMISSSSFFIAKIAFKRYYRIVEDATTSIVDHFKNYDSGETVTLSPDMEKGLHALIAQHFWTVQFTQWKLLKALFLQKHLLEANFDFPFVEYHQPAIEAGLDIFVAVWKLGMVNVFDMDKVNEYLEDYKKTFVFPEQMVFLTSAIAANIDEFAASFKILDNIVQMALVVTPSFDCSKIAHKYKFASNDIDFNVCYSIILKDLCKGYPDQGLISVDGELSLMQKLIKTQNTILRSPVVTQYLTKRFTGVSFFSRLSKPLFEFFQTNWKKNFNTLNEKFLTIKQVFFAQKFVLRKSGVTPSSSPDRQKVGMAKRKVEMEDVDTNRSFNYDYWLYGIGSTSEKEVVQPHTPKKKARTKTDSEQVDSEMTPAEVEGAQEVPIIEENTEQVARLT